jgi:hypothetical protein
MNLPTLALGLALAMCVSVVGQSAGVPVATQIDRDRDGIDDAVEQALLEHFVPSFMVSSGQCDVRPSLFLQGALDPVALQQDGTIYGQAFAISTAAAARRSVVVELHYYHLWQQDCRRTAHPLEVEHVSALVTADSMTAAPADWSALYWYASAQEGALCDKSHAARAGTLRAIDHGPVVYVSARNHASYLDASLCQQGCGVDSCDNLVPLAIPRVVNLGEPGAPLHGSDWTASTRWPLREQMSSDFSDGLLADLQSPGSDPIVAIHPAAPGTEATRATVNALSTAGKSTGHALGTANRNTGEALDTSAHAVGNALRKAASSTGQFLGTGKSAQKISN